MRWLIEAIENECNLIIAHHPLIFSSLKKINTKDWYWIYDCES